MATLPNTERDAFKDPLGPIYEDADALLADAGPPIVAVGDVVTYHLAAAGAIPSVSIVDGATEREPIAEAVERGLPAADREVAVENPAGSLTEPLLEALATALSATGSTLLRVDGEEDLAALPAVMMAPEGGSVVYGQPGEGMVLVAVTSANRDRVRDLCGRLDTERRFWDLVGADPPA